MCFDELKALGREFDVAAKAVDEFEPAGSDDDARLNALLAKQDAIAERIIAAPAFHASHVAVKARVATVVCRPTGDAIEERAMRALILAAYDAAL